MRIIRRSLLYLMALLVIVSCTENMPDTTKIRAEIESVEADFNAAVAEHGIHQGFLEFASDSAILIRNSQATIGKAAIAARFAQSSDAGQQLFWTPRRIEVARSGELAYSFGDFSFIRQDSTGTPDTLTGNFCTIWKKQKDGRWRFVVD